MVKLEEDCDRIALACKNHEMMKLLMIKASEAYFQALAKEKELWSEYVYSTKHGIQYLKELEESRIQFLKRSLSKYYALEKAHTAADIEGSSEQSACELINPAAEASAFQESLLKFEEVAGEDWVSYEQWKEILKDKGENPLITEENYISSEIDYKPMTATLALMKGLVHSLIPSRRKLSEESSSTDRSTLMETPGLDSFEHTNICDCSRILLDPEQWAVFINILDSRKYIEYIEPTCMSTLAGLISTIISLMMNEKLFKIEVFWKILDFSHSFYTIDGEKQYLFKFLNSHPIFQVHCYWVKLINFSISQKIQSEKSFFKKNQQRLKKQGKKAQKPNKNSTRSTVMSILSQFNFYMINLGTPCSLASKIISDCGTKANIGADRLFPLLSELHSIQTTTAPRLSRHKSLRLNSKSRSKWGLHLYLGLSFNYLPIHEIPTLLLVCKSWYSILHGHFCREALLSHGNTSFRTQAWASMLYRPCKKKYAEIAQELKTRPKSIQELVDVIHMDVLRSYANNPRINSQYLEEILRTYAFYRPKVGYCQGMHYLAGTLTQVLGHGEVAFWAMDEIIRLHHMQDLYSQDMSKLKVFFYVLDRFITENVPEARNLMNSETIVASHYSATWFITLFAGQLGARNEVLLRIWDYFILVRIR